MSRKVNMYWNIDIQFWYSCGNILFLLCVLEFESHFYKHVEIIKKRKMKSCNHSVNIILLSSLLPILIQKIIISLYQFMDILLSSEILYTDAVTELWVILGILHATIWKNCYYSIFKINKRQTFLLEPE